MNQPETSETREVRRDESGVVYVVDTETGEVVAQLAQPFAIEDDDRADWVLRKMANLETEIASLEEHPDIQAAKRVLRSPEVLQAQAAMAGLASLQAEARKRLEALHRRFDGELASYALAQLGPKDGRTKRFRWGEVSFRATQGSVKVQDPEKAVAFAASIGKPEAIVKTVQPSLLKEAVLALAQSESPPQGVMEAFVIELPNPDKPTIKVRGAE